MVAPLSPALSHCGEREPPSLDGRGWGRVNEPIKEHKA